MMQSPGRESKNLQMQTKLHSNLQSSFADCETAKVHRHAHKSASVGVERERAMAKLNGYNPQDAITDFDRLVEQQDQEMTQDGCISSFTRLQLEALESGEPIPHVWDTPAVREATERLLRGQRPAQDDEWYLQDWD